MSAFTNIIFLGLVSLFLIGCENDQLHNQRSHKLVCTSHCVGERIVYLPDTEDLFLGDMVLGASVIFEDEHVHLSGVFPYSYPLSPLSPTDWVAGESSFQMTNSERESSSCPSANGDLFEIVAKNRRFVVTYGFSYEFGIVEAQLEHCHDEQCRTLSPPEHFSNCEKGNFLF